MVTAHHRFLLDWEETTIAKAKKIHREVVIGGTKRWISGSAEQEYAENLVKALGSVTALQFEVRKANGIANSPKVRKALIDKGLRVVNPSKN